MKLTDLVEGETTVIANMKGEAAFTRHLAELGTNVMLVRRTPLFDPL